MNLKSYKNT